MSVQFCESEKGKKKLIKDGHSYYKNGQNQDHIYWKCDEYSVFNRRARIITKQDRIWSSNTDHNHVVDVAENMAKDLVSEVRL